MLGAAWLLLSDLGRRLSETEPRETPHLKILDSLDAGLHHFTLLLHQCCMLCPSLYVSDGIDMSDWGCKAISLLQPSQF